jgi:hypothetical protein
MEKEKRREGKGGELSSAVPLKWCCRNCSEHNKHVQIPRPEPSFLVLINKTVDLSTDQGRE